MSHVPGHIEAGPNPPQDIQRVFQQLGTTPRTTLIFPQIQRILEQIQNAENVAVDPIALGSFLSGTLGQTLKKDVEDQVKVVAGGDPTGMADLTRQMVAARGLAAQADQARARKFEEELQLFDRFMASLPSFRRPLPPGFAAPGRFDVLSAPTQGVLEPLRGIAAALGGREVRARREEGLRELGEEDERLQSLLGALRQGGQRDVQPTPPTVPPVDEAPEGPPPESIEAREAGAFGESEAAGNVAVNRAAVQLGKFLTGGLNIERGLLGEVSVPRGDTRAKALIREIVSRARPEIANRPLTLDAVVGTIIRDMLAQRRGRVDKPDPTTEDIIQAANEPGLVLGDLAGSPDLAADIGKLERQGVKLEDLIESLALRRRERFQPDEPEAPRRPGRVTPPPEPRQFTEFEEGLSRILQSGLGAQEPTTLEDVQRRFLEVTSQGLSVAGPPR